MIAVCWNRSCNKPKLHLEDSACLQITFLRQKRLSSSSVNGKVSALKSGKSEVRKDSAIHKLSPILEHGLLRICGRLCRAAMPEEGKHPVILSKDQHVSKLILRHIHVQSGHSGRNHMLSILREKNWITQANATARKIISSCTFCRRYKGKLGEQRMADLPTERITADLPSFTNVGVDYFGPIDVKRGCV